MGYKIGYYSGMMLTFSILYIVLIRIVDIYLYVHFLLGMFFVYNICKIEIILYNKKHDYKTVVD